MIFIGTGNYQSNNDENTDESMLLMSFVLIETCLVAEATFCATQTNFRDVLMIIWLEDSSNIQIG